MDKIKLILTVVVAVILLGLGVLVAIGLLQYILLFGVLVLAAVIAVRLWIGSGPRQIGAPDPKPDLKHVARTLKNTNAGNF